MPQTLGYGVVTAFSRGPVSPRPGFASRRDAATWTQLCGLEHLSDQGREVSACSLTRVDGYNEDAVSLGCADNSPIQATHQSWSVDSSHPSRNYEHVP